MPPRDAHDEFLVQARDMLLHWVRRHYRRLPPERAEDAVGEALLRYCKYRTKATVRSDIAVLMQLVKWTAFVEYRKWQQEVTKRVHPVVLPDGSIFDPIEEVPTIEPPILDPEACMENVVLPWIRENRPDDLELLRWRCAGTDWSEIARRLNIPRNTAIKRGSRAIEALRCHFRGLLCDDLIGGWFDEGNRS